MDVCCRNPNRTAPVGGAAPGRAGVPLCPRVNGWSWPPHPLQLLAWLLYAFFAVTGFGVFVPLLPAHWIPAGYICTGVLFVAHLVAHLLAVSVDPADGSVRAKKLRGPLPPFNRSQHGHVIQDCHCYLCQVDVGPKSKHCSACNKCVANFDHHCRWLNNCVGSRNYKLFLHSVVSALLGVSLVLVVASYVFIEFFVDPSKLRTDKHFLDFNSTGVWLLFLPVCPVSSAAAVIPGLAAVTVALGLLSSVLLSHLLCFHLYLMWNRLSTYEYIVRQRHRHDGRASGKPAALTEDRSFYSPPHPDREDRTTVAERGEDRTTVAARGEAEFLANGRLKSVSSPVMEEEALPTASTELTATHTHQRTQKKKKKIRKVPPETREHCTDPTPDAVGGSSVSVFPFPAFPLRASLPPLSGPPPLSVPPPLSGPPPLPAAPPSEYHSDSAESLEEIPVVLAKLGSSSSSDPPPQPRAPPSAPPRTLRKAPPPAPPRTLRKAPPPAELRFEMHPPTVFVSRASGEGGAPRGGGAHRGGGLGLTSWMEL